MTEPQYTDDEQVEKLKQWWRKNGISVIAGAVIGIGAVVGYNLWLNHKTSVAQEASGIYEEMMIRHSKEEVAQAEDFGARLMDDFQATPYAGKAALFLARLSVDKKDYDSALAQLQWAVDNAEDPATRHTGRVRRAKVLVETDRADDALSLLDVADMGGFESHYKEVRGDAFVAKGDAEKARAAYQESLDTLPDGSSYRDLLTLKLNSISASAN